MTRSQLDEYLDKGKSPVFVDIRCSDVSDFHGKLKEAYHLYNELTIWPRIVIGKYREVVIILNVTKI